MLGFAPLASVPLAALPQAAGTIGALAGTATAAATASGALTGRGALAGTSTGAGANSGALAGLGALSGVALAVASAGGVLINGSGAAGALAGTATSIAAASGLLTGRGALLGTAAAIATATGRLVGVPSWSPLTLPDIVAAFDAVFKALTGVGDLWVEGEIATPLQGRPWAQARMTAVAKAPTGPAANAVINWSGCYQVTVRVPRSSGAVAAQRIAATVTNQMPRGLAVPVTILATGTNRLVTVNQSSAMPEMEAGDWITVPVTILWMASDP